MKELIFYVAVTVVQVPANQIQDYCSPPAVACYKESVNKIYVREINGFYDTEKLNDLGHEILHAAGFKH